MYDCLITFRSVMPAQRAEGMLRQIGIECSVGRTPKWMERQGCGYSLRLDRRHMERVVALLDAHKISYRKLYLHREDGGVEEVRL